MPQTSTNNTTIRRKKPKTHNSMVESNELGGPTFGEEKYVL
jgi:hypothetical protein